MEMYYSIREGEIKFSEVASKYIKDSALKYQGGYRGQIKRKDLNPELRSIFSITAYPQIVKPIAAAQGFHLIWVETIIKIMPEPDIYQEIQDRLCA